MFSFAFRCQSEGIVIFTTLLVTGEGGKNLPRGDVFVFCLLPWSIYGRETCKHWDWMIIFHDQFCQMKYCCFSVAGADTLQWLGAWWSCTPSGMSFNCYAVLTPCFPNPIFLKLKQTSVSVRHLWKQQWKAERSFWLQDKSAEGFWNYLHYSWRAIKKSFRGLCPL